MAVHPTVRLSGRPGAPRRDRAARRSRHLGPTPGASGRPTGRYRIPPAGLVAANVSV